MSFLCSLGAFFNVEGQRTGIVSHSGLGFGEIYHQIIRNTSRKTICSYPKIYCKQAIAASVEELNDTLRPDSLVTSLLVLREFPKGLKSSERPSRRTLLQERAFIAETGE